MPKLVKVPPGHTYMFVLQKHQGYALNAFLVAMLLDQKLIVVPIAQNISEMNFLTENNITL